jgi:hypothetical protein
VSQEDPAGRPRLRPDLAPLRAFSLVSGGLFCAGAVAAICALLPGFVRYRALAPGCPAAQGSAGHRAE